MDLNASKTAYRKYIDDHIDTVGKLATNVIPKLRGRVSDDILSTLASNVKVHDVSKYDDNEFEAYRSYFFTADGDVKDKEVFDKAWVNHVRENLHHPEYWVDHSHGKIVTVEIPMEYLLECLCDLGAMSIKFSNTIDSYYQSNRTKFIMHEKTKVTFENLIPLFDESVLECSK